MPWSAMQKFRVRNGCMFRWAWLPPVFPTIAGDIATRLEAADRLTVAAEGCAQQREQRLILVDRQQLAVAQRPALRREVEAHDPDLRQERLRHPYLLGRPALTVPYCNC